MEKFAILNGSSSLEYQKCNFTIVFCDSSKDYRHRQDLEIDKIIQNRISLYKKTLNFPIFTAIIVEGQNYKFFINFC